MSNAYTAYLAAGRSSRGFWGGFVVAALFLLVGCGDDALIRRCLADSDCAGDGVCLSGRCEGVDAGTEPDGGGPVVCLDRCGSHCCEPGLICRHGRCIPPCAGQWCGRSSDTEVCCAEEEQCSVQGCFRPPPDPPDCDGGVWEPAFETCLEPVEIRECEQLPPGPHDLVPQVLWRFEATDGFPQVMTTPLVVDVNGDGAADVLASFYSTAEGYSGTAVLRALSGLDGSELWKTPYPSGTAVMAPSGLAVAALGDGKELTVLAVDEHSQLVAFDARTGEERWRSRTIDGDPAPCDVGWGAPAVANIDLSGFPEIVCGFTVFDNFGVLRWSAASSASGPYGSVVALGDLDGDGRLDLTDGTRAFRFDGLMLWNTGDTVPGLAAVADFLSSPQDPTLDGKAEVLVVRSGRLELLDGRTGRLLIRPNLLPTIEGFACYGQSKMGGWGGPPAVADVTGDGTTDVVVGSGECIGAFELRTSGTGLEWKVLWSEIAIDESSSATTPSLFDFDADGSPDVVYADERRLQIFQGVRGAPIFDAPHCSGTLYEAPAIADVDGDASANVIVASNVDRASDLKCSPDVPPGITVYREKSNRWANARPVWTQHGYSPAASCDGADEVCRSWTGWNTPGRIPFEVKDRLKPPYNGIRFNSHGQWKPLGIPNPAVTHAVVDASSCPASLVVRVRVVNAGEAPLRAQTPVRMISRGRELARGATAGRILPGESEIVALEWSPAPRTPWPVEAVIEVGPLRGQTQCDPEDDVLPITLASCP